MLSVAAIGMTVVLGCCGRDDGCLCAAEYCLRRHAVGGLDDSVLNRVAAMDAIRFAHEAVRVVDGLGKASQALRAGDGDACLWGGAVTVAMNPERLR
jgi:hypothetical protein